MTDDATGADTAGLVLAGGRSRRFDGGDKAFAVVGGEPMVGRVARRLASTVDRVVLNPRPDQATRIERAVTPLVDVPVAVAPDPVADEGPLAGLATGLAATDAPLVAVVACDVPLLDPGLLATAAERLAAGDADAVVPSHDGTRQPTHAVYRREPAVAASEAALSAGERSLFALLDRLAVERLPVGPERAVAFTDVDTRGALARVAPNTCGPGTRSLPEEDG